MEDPGKFDRLVSFQVATTTKTGAGGVQKGFAHSFYAWCSRESIGEGNEQYLNDRLTLPYRYRYKTHYLSSINETMQIVDEDIAYNILSISPGDFKMFIEFVAERVTE